MKSLIIVAALFLSSQVMAGDKIVAKTVSCAQLQAEVKAEGKIYIKGKIGGNTYVAERNMCAYDEEAVSAYISTQDKLLCRAGYVYQETNMYKN